MENLSMDEIKANCLSSISELAGGGVGLLLEQEESGLFKTGMASDALPFDGKELSIDPALVDPTGTLPAEVKAEMLAKSTKDLIESMAADLTVFAECILDSDKILAILVFVATDTEGVSHATEEKLRQLTTSIGLVMIAAEEMNDSLQNSNIDPLTGFFNRRYLEPGLRTELARASRYGHTLSLVCFQPDHLENADEFTREISKLLRSNADPMSVLFSFRTSDIPLRTGKNQFMVMLPETPKWGALTKADRFRKAVRELPLGGKHQTVSVGVATFPEDASDHTALVNAAQYAMDQAAKNGGDKVIQA